MTSLTFQNAAGVFGATHETPKSLRAQIVPVIEEERISAIKIGMLPTAELVSEVAALIRDSRLPAPVLDPVLRSSSGVELMEPEAIQILLNELLPLALLITPNIPEAEILTGARISNEQQMRGAAARLRDLGARAVLIKGGHANWEPGAGSQESGEAKAIDLLDDGGEVSVVQGEWIDAPPVRGTGCMMSSAIAVKAAKKYVALEIQNSKLETQN